MKQNSKFLKITCFAIVLFALACLPMVQSCKSKPAPKSLSEQKITIPYGECVYTGAVNPQGVPDGEGQAKFADGSFYRGRFKKGHMEDDNAKITYANGDSFHGSFVQDKIAKGRYTYADSSYYNGSFIHKNGTQQFNYGTMHDAKGKTVCKYDGGKKVDK